MPKQLKLSSFALDRFFEKVECLWNLSDDDCWNWIGSKSPDGYGHIIFGKSDTRSAHTVAYTTFIGPIPVGECVLHECDNPSCINPNHLFTGTREINNIDAAIKQRKPTKVSLEDIEKINKLYLEGNTQEDIAKMFAINQSQVSRIINFKRRQHLRLSPLPDMGTGINASTGTEHQDATKLQGHV